MQQENSVAFLGHTPYFFAIWLVPSLRYGCCVVFKQSLIETFHIRILPSVPAFSLCQSFKHSYKLAVLRDDGWKAGRNISGYTQIFVYVFVHARQKSFEQNKDYAHSCKNAIYWETLRQQVHPLGSLAIRSQLSLLSNLLLFLQTTSNFPSVALKYSLCDYDSCWFLKSQVTPSPNAGKWWKAELKTK